MVLQVLADARQVDDQRNAVARQFARRADPRQHQQLRRHEAARREDDLARLDRSPVPPPRRTATPVTVVPSRMSFVDLRLGDDRQVRPAADRVEIGALGGHPLAVLLGEGVEADAVLSCAVEVGVERMAGQLRGFQIGSGQRIDAARRRDVERAVRAMERRVDLLSQAACRQAGWSGSYRGSARSSKRSSLRK